MPELPASDIRNYDCMFLISKIDRTAKEILESASAGLNDYSEADKVRLQSYINSFSAWLDHSSAQPALDKPHSHPMTLPVPSDPMDSQPDIDNDAAKALLHELRTFRINVHGCQSSDLSNNYMAQDLARFKSYVAKVQALLTGYIGTVQPLDLPETSQPGK